MLNTRIQKRLDDYCYCWEYSLIDQTLKWDVLKLQHLFKLPYSDLYKSIPSFVTLEWNFHNWWNNSPLFWYVSVKLMIGENSSKCYLSLNTLSLSANLSLLRQIWYVKHESELSKIFMLKAETQVLVCKVHIVKMIR